MKRAVKYYLVSQGENFPSEGEKIVKPIAELTLDQVKENIDFKRYIAPYYSRQPFPKPDKRTEHSASTLLFSRPPFTAVIHKQSKNTPNVNSDEGTWTGRNLKPYNFNALGKPMATGALHPLMKMREEMRRILLDMGFEEMPTNRFVESSFWNFDSLFQPQQHPARDAHDTFFLKS